MRPDSKNKIEKTAGGHGPNELSVFRRHTRMGNRYGSARQNRYLGCAQSLRLASDFLKNRDADKLDRRTVQLEAWSRFGDLLPGSRQSSRSDLNTETAKGRMRSEAV